MPGVDRQISTVTSGHSADRKTEIGVEDRDLGREGMEPIGILLSGVSLRPGVRC